MRTISCPDNLRVGMEVFVIERKSRTGLEDDVYRNMVTGIGIFSSGIGFKYIHESYMPEYFADFDEIGKTVFFTKEKALAALKKEKRRGRKEQKNA